MPDPSNSQVIIINKALAHIKIRSVSSITEQSEPARKANLFYDCVRRSLLRAADWRFAKVKKVLTLLGDMETATLNPTDLSKQDVVPPWMYTYAYPANCVKFRKVFTLATTSQNAPWDNYTSGDMLSKPALWEETRSPQSNVLAISTNYQAAWCEFTYDITDETQFDDLFQDCMSWLLAADLAIPLACDKELAQLVGREAERQVGEAKRINASEGLEMQPRGSNYESSRSGSDRLY